MLYVKSINGKGNGVFSDVPIAKGAIIETCNVLPVSVRDADICEDTIFDSYIYVWGDAYALVFGFGMLYNHSDTPNAETDEDAGKEHLLVRAIRDIPAHEEITFDYTGEGRPLIFQGEDWIYGDTKTPYQA